MDKYTILTIFSQSTSCHFISINTQKPWKKRTSKFFTPLIVHLLHKVHPGCKVREMPYLFIVAGASKCLL